MKNNILVILHTDYQRSQYHEGIDHLKYDVYYFGTESMLKTVPHSLPHQNIIYDESQDLAFSIIYEVNKLNIKFNFIVANSELTLLPAAIAREKLGIAGNLPDQVNKVINKVIMKNCIKNSGLKYPAFIEAKEFLAQLPKSTKMFKKIKIVLKPITGSGSEGIQFFNTVTTLTTYLKLEKININEYEIEEYIDGNIYHIDALINDSKIVDYVPSQYLRTCSDFAKGIPFGSFQLQKSAIFNDILLKTIQALNITFGPVHLELIKSTLDNEFYFLEVANRTGGAEIRPLFSKKTGINLSASECSLQIGQSIIYNETAEKDLFFAFFQFPGHHLNFDYCNVIGIEKWLTHPNLLYLTKLAEDKKLSKSITYRPDKIPISGTLVANSPLKLENVLMQILVDKTIQVVPKATETTYAIK